MKFSEVPTGGLINLAMVKKPEDFRHTYTDVWAIKVGNRKMKLHVIARIKEHTVGRVSMPENDSDGLFSVPEDMEVSYVSYRQPRQFYHKSLANHIGDYYALEQQYPE